MFPRYIPSAVSIRFPQYAGSPQSTPSSENRQYTSQVGASPGSLQRAKHTIS